MIWLRDLLLGLLTRHLGTKALALLLSVGLFGFVQASLGGTLEIARLELKFVLADELRVTTENVARPQYMLTTEKMIFNNLTISGLRRTIEPLAKTNSLTLVIDQRILNDGEPDPFGIAIPITPALFRDETLFGKDVRVGPADLSARLIVNRVETRSNVRVELAPGLLNVVSPDYEGKLSFAVNVKQVSIKGPLSAFEGADPRIVVDVKNVLDKISTLQLQGDSGELAFGDGVCEVLWAAGSINPQLRDTLRLTAEKEFGNEAMTPRDFQNRLKISCVARKKKHGVDLKAVPIEVLYPAPRGLDLKDWTSLTSSVLTDGDLNNGYVQRLTVRVPATLAGDQEFLNNIVFVLDVAAAEKDVGDVVKVPYHLGLKDSRRSRDLERLAQVEMVLASGTEPVVQFRKRS